MLRMCKIAVLLAVVLFLSSCGGGGGGTITSSSIPSVSDNSSFSTDVQNAFKEWDSTVSSMTPKDFVAWWNDTERFNNWTFSYYGQNGLVWPDPDGPEKIFASKFLNCYRMAVMLKNIYGGEAVTLYQPTASYDHVILLLYSNDEKSYVYVSYPDPSGGSPLKCAYKVLNTNNRNTALSEITATCFPGTSVSSTNRVARF